MKKLVSIIKSDLKRGIFSKRFLAAVLIMTLAVFVSAWQSLFITNDQRLIGLPHGYFLIFINKALQSEGIVFVLPIFSPLPFAGNFIEEFRTRFSNFLLIRSKKSQYIASKIIVNGLCGGLCVCLGVLIATGLCGIIYGSMELSGDFSILQLFLHTTVFSILKISFIGILWASVGTFLGLINKSIYMVYGGPFLINYLLVILTTRYFINAYILSPREWLLQQHVWHDNSAYMCLFLLIISAIAIVLEGVTIRWKLERK